MDNECTLTDQELINKIDSLNGALCKSGGKSWRLSVPPDVNNDPDLLIAELVKRFERAKLSKEGVKVWISFDAEPLNYCRMYSIEPYELEVGNAYGCRGGSISDISYGFARMLNVQKGECKAFEIRECL